MLVSFKQPLLIFFAAIGLTAMILIPTLSVTPAHPGPIISLV